MTILRSTRFFVSFFAAFLFLLSPQPAAAVNFICNDGTSVYGTSAAVCNGHGGVKTYYYVCGDGIVDVGEQCDNGSNNSDVQPNACRTDCRFAYCGDGVIDSGEQCDSNYLANSICTDFDKNGVMSNNIQEQWFWGGSPKCKNNCTFDLSECHYCGDGVVQPDKEQCDDGNSTDDDGCNTDCTSCIALTSNPDITSDTQICTADYSADDYGDLGAIIIKAPNLTLDCDGARLTGTGDGIGIYIKRSDNVMVKNCNIDNYEFGIYAEDSDNIQVLGMGNKITNTSDQIVLDNSTAQPAAQPQMQQFGGMSPNAQALMGQQIQPKSVTPQAGDALKAQAMPSAAAKLKTPDRSPQAVPAKESREERRTRLKAEREARAAEQRAEREKLRATRERSDTRAVTKEVPRSFTPPGTVQQISRPVILQPKADQQFRTTETITVRAQFDSKRRIRYLLKGLPDNRIVQRSRDGRFGKLEPGRYCAAAVYVGRNEKESPCIVFNVNPVQRDITPLKAPLRLQRQ